MPGKLFDEKSSILKVLLETCVKGLERGVVDEGRFLGLTRSVTLFGLLLFRSVTDQIFTLDSNLFGFERKSFLFLFESMDREAWNTRSDITHRLSSRILYE